jgi:alpha,alpha-trehalose phosphorylase
MRGTFDEGRPTFDGGTFVNGFYESWPIIYAEKAFGFAETGQTIVDVPDAKIIRLHVDDEPLYLPTANLLEFERALDMARGTLQRELLWETPSGKRVRVRSTRLASLKHRHLGAISYEVTVENDTAPIVISSQIVTRQDFSDADADPRRPRGFQHRVLDQQDRRVVDARIMLGYRTHNSGMTLAAGIDHVIETECPYTMESSHADDVGKTVFSVDARPGVSIHIVKYVTYHTSRSAPPAELCDRAERTLDRARRHGFAELQEDQRELVAGFWRDGDVEVRGDDSVQQAIRFNLFQILQATARAEGVGIPAKGVTGRGYEGHYFWDTEIYVIPFLIYTAPRIARNLLKFRHGFLDQARERARQVNQKGALFPWRTINGHEASSYYAAGTAQYHLNADIAYALKKYVDVTGDRDFLLKYGTEILVETARLWVDLGFYSERRDGKFCIHGVTGPDEYNTVVDNNTFTNLMARENLWYAADTAQALRDEDSDAWKVLVDHTRLEDDEIGIWRQAADRMYIPFDDETRVHPQDDQFLFRKPWDFENTPADRYPLLLHYHPLVIYRHKVIKQADVVLAMFLLGHEFSGNQKRRNFDYYDPLTTGDSSLSSSIQAIVAAELGYDDLARRYAFYGALMDLDDVAGNVRDGLHIASMGGTWMAVVYGLAGLRDWDGRILFDPRRPPAGTGFRFPLRIRDRRLVVDVGCDSVTYTLEEGDELQIWHVDREVVLTRTQPSSTHPLGDPQVAPGADQDEGDD